MEKVQRRTELTQNKDQAGKVIILPEGTVDIEITKRTLAHDPLNPQSQFKAHSCRS